MKVTTIEVSPNIATTATKAKIPRKIDSLIFAVRGPACKKLKKKKKKWTHPRFLHRRPKKAVEQDSDIHFDLT